MQALPSSLAKSVVTVLRYVSTLSYARFSEYCTVFLAGLLALAGDVYTTSAQTKVTVAADGSGQFKTVQEAINAVPQNTRPDNPAIILVKPGTYKELIYVQHEKRFIHLLGEAAETTILTYDLNATLIGKGRQTHRHFPHTYDGDRCR